MTELSCEYLSVHLTVCSCHVTYATYTFLFQLQPISLDRFHRLNSKFCKFSKKVSIFWAQEPKLSCYHSLLFMWMQWGFYYFEIHQIWHCIKAWFLNLRAEIMQVNLKNLCSFLHVTGKNRSKLFIMISKKLFGWLGKYLRTFFDKRCHSILCGFLFRFYSGVIVC